jgi:hypothetical protein
MAGVNDLNPTDSATAHPSPGSSRVLAENLPRGPYADRLLAEFTNGRHRDFSNKEAAAAIMGG